MARDWRDIGYAIALVVTVFAVLSPVFRADFIWDDVIITATSEIYEANGLLKLWLQPRVVSGELHYWPLTYTTFWLEDRLWGFNPVSSHAVNLTLHAINCLLAWQLLRALDIPGAMLAALIFAVHPVHVEPVAWVIGRKDLLAAMFYLLSALLWLRAWHSPNPIALVGSALLFAAAMVSKSTAITLPMALIVLIWWQTGRLRFRDIALTIPHMVIALSIGVADSLYYASNEPLSFGYSIVERVINAARALCFYAGKLAYPSDLIIIYDRWELDALDPRSWLYVIAAIAVPIGAWRLRSHVGLGPLVALAFFAITLLPALGFMDFGYMNFAPVADRYQYLASLGPIALLAAGLAIGVGTLSLPRRAVAALPLCAVLVVLSYSSWRQSGLYADELTFFTHITDANPEARSASHNLGKQLYAAKRYEDAIEAVLRETRLSPNNFEPHALIALSLHELGRVDEAIIRLQTALELEEDSEFVLENLVEMHGQLGQYEEQIDYLVTLQELQGASLDRHLQLARAFIAIDRLGAARREVMQAQDFVPNDAQRAKLQLLLGEIALGEGRPEQAREHFEQSIAAAKSTEARAGLARASLALDDFEQARRQFAILTTIDGSNADYHAGLAAALLALGRLEDALLAANQASSFEPTHQQATHLAERIKRMIDADQATQ